MKIDTGLLHDRLHRPDGVFATIRAHYLWRDVDIIQNIDPFLPLAKLCQFQLMQEVKQENPDCKDFWMKFKLIQFQP